MAIKPLTISLLNTGMVIVDENGRVNAMFVQNLNNIIQNLASAFNALAGVSADQGDILDQLLEINGLIEDVNGNLVAIDGRINGVQSDLITQTITNSYTDPSVVLTSSYNGTSGTITIAAHQRVYTDGMTVSVAAGSLTGFNPDTYQYVYYQDPTRAGGAVTYQATTDIQTAAQINGVHSLGGILIPKTSGGTGSGGGSTPPGTGGRYQEMNAQ